MYKVIYKFADLQDKNHVYEVGDVFPREGKEVTDERIAELASVNNKIGKTLIKASDTAQKTEDEEIIDEPKKIDSKPSEKPETSK